MKFKCETKELFNICSNISRIVSTKAQMPALEGLLITAGENVTVTGYDLECGVKTSIEADIKEQGAVILNTKICEILKNLPETTVSIEVSKNFQVKIKSGNAKFTLIGLDPADYPQLPNIDENEKITINGPILKDMIRKSIFATAEDNNKPVHAGIKFELSKNHIKLVAVDGFRLAIQNEVINYSGKDQNFVVPKKALNEITKLPESENINLSADKRYIVIEVGNYKVISKLLDGEFLNYNQAISFEPKTTVKVNTRELIGSIERTSLIISNKVKSPLKLHLNECIEISSLTTLGSANDKVNAKIEGKELEIGFNNRFLLEALKACDTDEVLINFGTAISPITINPIDNNNFLFLVLPVRLKEC